MISVEFVIGILLSIIGVLCVFILNDISKKLNGVFKHLENHSARILTIENQCDYITKKGV